MTNMTITVDEEVLRWAKVWAAKQGTSVSRLVGELLRDQMRRDNDYAEAMEAHLALPAHVLIDGSPDPSRAEIHDRPSR